jgi:hypothetical protein
MQRQHSDRRGRRSVCGLGEPATGPGGSEAVPTQSWEAGRILGGPGFCDPRVRRSGAAP